MFALVKWLSGEDKNKFTAGVPTDWIRDFNIKTFKQDGYPSDHSFISEWRVGKKPAGGWPVYDVLVVEISEKVSILEKRIQVMSLSRSPKQVHQSHGVRSSPRKSTQARASLFTMGKKTSSPVKKAKAKPSLFASSKTGEKKEKSFHEAASFNKKLSQEAASFDKKPSHEAASFDKKPIREISGLDVLPPESAAPAVMSFTRSEFNDFKLDLLNEVKSCLTPLSKRLDALEKVITERPSHPEPANNDSTVGPSSVAASGETQKVRLGTVVMPKHAYDAALATPTASAMTKSLLVASFPLKVLLKSTYKGGKTKVGDNKGRTSCALDANVLAALRECVVKKYANFTSAQFGTAVNQKLTSLKSKFKESESAPDQVEKEEKTQEEEEEEEEDKMYKEEPGEPPSSETETLQNDNLSLSDIEGAHTLSASDSEEN